MKYSLMNKIIIRDRIEKKKYKIQIKMKRRVEGQKVPL